MKAFFKIRKEKPVLFSAALLLAVTAAGLTVQQCASSPTGRKQLTVMTDAQMNEMGVKAFDELKQKTPIDRGPAVNNYVKCVANAIIAVSEDTTGVDSWEIVVFRDNSANAFALPGGKIGVHTGILPVAKTPGQLAAVLAHEVVHVLARHGNERVSQSVVTSSGMSMVEGFLGGGMIKEAIVGGLGIGAQYGVLLPFSRAHETEADVYGQELMAKAGFNPVEARDLWVNMSQLGGGKGPSFMSTHPSSEKRIKDLEEGLEKTLKIYAAAQAEGRKPDCKL